MTDFVSNPPLSRRGLLQNGAAGGLAGITLIGGPAIGSTASATSPAPAGAERPALLDALADTIIPATDTPGAAEAGVPDFIRMMVARWLHPDERTRFTVGLQMFDETIRSTTGQAFEHLPPPRRLELLQRMAGTEAGASATLPQSGPFIAQLRALVIYGYYTSEVGASQELDLNLAPGEYDPCHEIQHGEHGVSLGRSNAVLRLP